MYYAKRPSPFTYAAAGGIFTVGVGSLIGRALHTFTSFTLDHPFDWILYITAVLGTYGGGGLIIRLIVRNYRSQIAALKAENAQLHADCDAIHELKDAVQAADQQGEINGVRLNKILKILEGAHIVDADADTQPLARLHAINGGSGA